MPTQYSNHRDTPLRRFNTFWWGLAYFGVFGLVSAVVYWQTGKPVDPVAVIRSEDRMEVRKKVDAAQGEMLPPLTQIEKMTDVIKGGAKASDQKVAGPPPVAKKLPDSPGLKLFTAKTCVTCHGADAASAIQPNYPNLAGQNAEYTLAQLNDFADGKRTSGQSAVMTGIMAMVNPDERKQLADWLASLEKAPVTLPEGPGKDLYIAKACASCHGMDGNTPILPIYPKIAGQNSQYIYDQLKAIKDGTRNNGQSAAMKAIMANVNDEEMKQLAEWLSGQK
ncbi:MAG: cytochrome c [Verrucomicrobiae bacterium]|nr:cytochrome c [Verrucomicrobiae bacterium]NNJ85551.1 cytochrome c [Akkermansiaceae bacterium]